MASVEPLFDPERDAWFDLDLDSAPREPGKVSLKRREWQRHGDASHWLISEAFDLREPETTGRGTSPLRPS